MFQLPLPLYTLRYNIWLLYLLNPHFSSAGLAVWRHFATNEFFIHQRMYRDETWVTTWPGFLTSKDDYIFKKHPSER